MTMSESGDTMVEVLRRANPVPGGQTADRRSSPSAHALLAGIIAEPPQRVSRRMRRRVLLVSVAVVCYAAADRHARRIVTPAVGDPRESCARLFENGTFADIGITRVPPRGFDVCALPGGVPGVFPGESGSVCKRLGYPEAAPDRRDITDFLVAIDRRVSASCVPRAPAERIIESEEVKHGLRGWKIELGARRYDSAHPCTSLNAVPAKETITLVPIADPRVPPPTIGR